MAGLLHNLKAGVADSTDIVHKTFAAGSALTLDPETHAGGTIYLDTAAGSTVTLPSATGSGDVYFIEVQVLATSNSHVVQVTTTDVMDGCVLIVDQDTAGTVTGFVTAATSDTITLNRSTSGSVTIGEWLRVEDIASANWAVFGVLTNTGNGATPFSAAVS